MYDAVAQNEEEVKELRRRQLEDRKYQIKRRAMKPQVSIDTGLRQSTPPVVAMDALFDFWDEKRMAEATVHQNREAQTLTTTLTPWF